MIPARSFSDDEIVRNRAGSLTKPPPSRYNVIGWTAAVMFAFGWAVGLICGIGA
jgi:hypothetical protein